MKNEPIEERASGCSIIIFLIFGMLVVVLAWHWMPEIIRKSTTSFNPAASFPVTGTFVSSQYRSDPNETRNSELIMELVNSNGDKDKFLLMTYKPDVGAEPIKLLFTVEKWQQVFMRKEDKVYGHNATLRAVKFINEVNESIEFKADCRLVGQNASFGPSLRRRFSTNLACVNPKNVIILKGYLYRSGGVLCVELSIRTNDKAYEIQHRSQLGQCLKKQKLN